MKTEKPPQIQIDKTLFLDLCRWHLAGLQDETRKQRIESALKAKIDSMAAREEYTATRKQ